MSKRISKIMDWQDKDKVPVNACAVLSYEYPKDDGTKRTSTRYLKKIDDKGGARFVKEAEIAGECTGGFVPTSGTVVAGINRSLQKKTYGLALLLESMGKYPTPAQTITVGTVTAVSPTLTKKAWNPFQQV